MISFRAVPSFVVPHTVAVASSLWNQGCPAHLRCMSSYSIAADQPEEIPLALPLAIITVGEIGAVSVTLDGAELPPPAPAEAWTRAQLGEILDALTMERSRTVRIDLRESDGSVFTDIIHAVQRKQAIVDVQPFSAIRRARHRPTHQPTEVTGSGFVPGEDVTVALSVSSAEGSADGSARAVIDVTRLLDNRSEILLIGRVSGVTVTEHLLQ